VTAEFSDEPTQENLFGEVWYDTAGKRGRPPFERTLENANKILMLLAAGWTNERIAECTLDPRTGKSISVKTLKRYFSPELSSRFTARDRLRAKRLMRLWAMAEEGSVAAEKLFGQLMEENDRAVAEAEYGDRPQPDADTAPRERVGKKVMDEQLALDADAALAAELDNEVKQNVRH